MTQMLLRRGYRSAIQRHPLVAFFVFAYAISWGIALPLVASAQGLLPVSVPFALHYLTAYGPLVAALIVTRITDGPDGLRDLLGRMIKWRVWTGWVLVAALSPLALFAFTVAAVSTLGGPLPDVRLLGRVNFLPNLGVGAWLLWILTNGIGEETGWRGFALPKLQKHRSALSATLILSIFWVFWHLPSFFYLPNFMTLGLAGFPGFAISVLAGAILLTWLYNSTHGSILMVALWHGGFNFVTASEAGGGAVATIMSVLVMVWAVIVVLVFRPAKLSHAEKQVR